MIKNNNYKAQNFLLQICGRKNEARSPPFQFLQTMATRRGSKDLTLLFKRILSPIIFISYWRPVFFNFGSQLRLPYRYFDFNLSLLISLLPSNDICWSYSYTSTSYSSRRDSILCSDAWLFVLRKSQSFNHNFILEMFTYHCLATLPLSSYIAIVKPF